MGNNYFELTPELVEQIIFAMENQKETFLLDMEVPAIIQREAEARAKGDVCELPLWEPSDGYRLMEQFVLTLRNPVYREHLSSILHCGSGVFRKYKDALNQRPDIERMWFAFKEKEMKTRVYDWYNALRLEWGLDVFEVEFNGDYSPVLTDFSVTREMGSNLAIIQSMDRIAFDEILSAYPRDYISDLYRRLRDGFEPEISDDSIVYSAISPNDGIVGFVWLTHEILESGTSLGTIRQIYVLPDFRGLGLGSKLKESALEDPLVSGADIVEMQIPIKAEFLKNDLLQQDFEKNGTLLILNRKKNQS